MPRSLRRVRRSPAGPTAHAYGSEWSGACHLHRRFDGANDRSKSANLGMPLYPRGVLTQQEFLAVVPRDVNERG